MNRWNKAYLIHLKRGGGKKGQKFTAKWQKWENAKKGLANIGTLGLMGKQREEMNGGGGKR